VGSNLIYADDKVSYNDTLNDFKPETRNINVRADFHVYAFEWVKGKVTWFIDGEVIRTSAGSAVPVSEESAKVMMNLWIFNNTCNFGGPCTALDYPIWSEYDWFRFYKWNEEDTYPCSPTPGCLPDSDLDGAKNNPSDGVPNVMSPCTG
jgi:beta-glucanase (GH16 family)